MCGFVAVGYKGVNLQRAGSADRDSCTPTRWFFSHEDRSFTSLPALALSFVSAWITGRVADKEVVVPAPASADAAWAAIEAMVAFRQPPEIPPKSLIDYYTALEANDRQLQPTGLDFIARHPADPRRWEVAYILLTNQPNFYGRFQPAFEEVPTEDNVEIDVAARDEWKVRRAELIALIQAAPDASAKVKGWAAVHVLHAEYAKADAPVRPALIPKIVALAEQFPESEEVHDFVYPAPRADLCSLTSDL